MRRRDVLGALPFLATGSKILAQAPDQNPPDRRVALCIGITDYAHFPKLPSALPDANLIGRSLVALGFHASLVSNPSYDDFLLALAKFRLIAKGSSLAVLYIAAHGFMRDGQSHILASDSLHQVRSAIPESVLLRAISDQPRQKVLFLDTCRELPEFSPNVTNDQVVDSPYRAGVHVGYATQPQAPAFDGIEGHSPYAHALNQGLTVQGIELAELSRQVRLSVLQATSGAQIPWDKSSLLLPIVLNQMP